MLIQRFTPRTLLVLLVGLMLSVGCADPPGRLVVTQPRSEHAVPVDLDTDGISEFVILTDQNPGRLAPIDSSAVVVKTLSDRILDQVNIPGVPVALRALSRPRQDAALAFTRKGDRLLAYLLEADIDGAVGIDTTATVTLFRSPVEPEFWDVSVGEVTTIASGNFAVVLASGHSKRPRGVLELDRRTLEIVNSSFVDAKLQTMQLNRRTGSLYVGSHAAENGAVGLDLTDSLAYLVEFDRDFRRSEVVAAPGRFGAVGVFPESDSTLLAFVRQDSPPEAHLLRLSPSTGLDGEEIRLWSVEAATRMVSGNFVGGASFDVAFASRGGGVTVVDLETLERWFFETYGPASVGSVGDVDRDGIEELSVATPERTWLIQDQQVIGMAEGSLHLHEHLYGDTYLGFDEGWTLVRLVPDREALQERRSLLIAIALGALAVLVANFLLYWFFGPRATRIPTADFYQYLVLGDVNTRTKFDHLVRIRRTLEDHAQSTGFSVDDLAKKAGFSSTRDLNRAVKAASGTTARKLIEQFRLNRAAEELAAGHKTVEEIATSVGFSSHQYFTTRFKKTFGLTPSEYRAK